MRKDVIFLFALFIILFSAPFISAQEASEETVRTRAFACVSGALALENSVTLEQALFAGIASFEEDIIAEVIDEAKSATEECYIPSTGGSCDVKTTAQALLAKRRRGEDTTGISDWLLNQSISVQGLVWYLQITMADNKPATCGISYNNQAYEISINDDMELVGNPGTCLSIADEAYRLRINDGNGCLDHTYRVSCESTGETKSDFITNLMYKQNIGSDVHYISPETKKQAHPLSTEHIIEAKCFTSGTSCDYEGSLWAALALYDSGKEYSLFIPYLRSFSSENAQFFPESFLRYLDRGSIADVKSAGIQPDVLTAGVYWDVSSPYTTIYDTALGLLGVGGLQGQPEVLPYLASQQNENSGCFAGNPKDTAFIIYGAGWSGQINSCSTDSDCSSGYSCLNSVCVNTQPCGSDSDCGNGEICSAGQCIDSDAVCLDVGGTCRSSCNSNEAIIGAQCEGTGQECCIPDSGGPGPGPTIPEGATCEEADATCRAECNSDERAVNASCENTADSCCYVDDDDDDFNNQFQTDCSQAGYYCSPDYFACIDAGGEPLDSLDYYCSGIQTCCTVDVAPEPPQSCFNQGGEVCAADEVCDGSNVGSSDGPCCIGSCDFDDGDDFPPGGPECFDNEDCSEGEECSVSGSCVPEEGGSGWFWIILLLILIILVVLAIIFRDKIKIWWFKVRGKNKGKSLGPTRGPPGGPPPRRGPPQFGQRPGFPLRPGAPPRPMRRPTPGPPQRPPKPRGNSEDKEMEETLRKLKEISK